MLRFCFGPSGAGKSTALYSEVIEESLREPDTDFLIIVPDQFTMQVQRDVVRLHPDRGIMNIDVLSFSRLSHRIFDEVGEPGVPVLDDLGKTLLLRHVADGMADKLPLIGRRMRQAGFADEIKSLISEFLQYRVSPEDLDILAGVCGLRGQLKARLEDLRALYRAFEDEIEGSYMTAEETMDVLAERIPESGLIRGAVVVFDGFTGFTPIQYHVLSSIFKTAKRVTISLVIEPGDDPWDMRRESIFNLSKRAAADLEHAAFIAQTKEGDDTSPEAEAAWAARRRKIAGDIYIGERPVRRLRDDPALAFLEERLFRDGGRTFSAEGADPFPIALVEAPEPAAECEACCLEIRRRIRRDSSLKYGDIAVLCTDMKLYARTLEREAGRLGLPVYLDKTGSVEVDPLTELFMSAADIVRTGYESSAVFRFMRCPLSGFDSLSVDRLELYIKALGIRGRSRYDKAFLRTIWRERPEEAQAELLKEMNALRERLSALMTPLFEADGGDVRGISLAFIGLFDALGVQGRLKELAARREEEGDAAGRREYEQIYKKLIDLMDQVVALMGEERLKVAEYGELIKTGIDKITIGMIPGSMDRIVVGDLERTRLGEKRVLFLLGANDTLLPRTDEGGGFLSEIDRRFLKEARTGVELAPGPEDKLDYEREYLYMSLTKPREALVISWSEAAEDGRALRPAELVRRIRELFPGIETVHGGAESPVERAGTIGSALGVAAELFRDYADGELSEDSGEQLLAVAGAIASEGTDGDRERLRKLAAETFYKYQPLSMERLTASALYGTNLENSVSRLELFAGCPFAHFASYGLRLREDEVYELNAADLGTVYHAALEGFDRRLAGAGLDWLNFDEKTARELMEASLDDFAAQYRNNLFLSNARYQTLLSRMERILLRTADTLQYQLSKGEFKPMASEWDFKEAGAIPETAVTLNERTGERVFLHGRIDRADICESGGNSYIKIIDFKSGVRTHAPALLYHGIELQLMLYMRVAMGHLRNSARGRDVIPAGVFYYRMADPILSGDDNKISNDILSHLRKKLSLSGVASSDPDVLSLMDRDLSAEGSSDILPVSIKRDGGFTAYSHVYGREDFELASDHVGRTIVSLGRRIKGGEVAVAPYRYGKRSACDFCAYKGVCGFDARVPGYAYRNIAKMSEDEALERMRAARDKEDG